MCFFISHYARSFLPVQGSVSGSGRSGMPVLQHAVSHVVLSGSSTCLCDWNQEHVWVQGCCSLHLNVGLDSRLLCLAGGLEFLRPWVVPASLSGWASPTSQGLMYVLAWDPWELSSLLPLALGGRLTVPSFPSIHKCNQKPCTCRSL